MTKNNKLLLGILAFIVSITIGYAVFTQSVTVQGTAIANGNFQITPYCTPGISQNFIADMGVSQKEVEEAEADEKGYSGDTCTPGANSVSFSVNLNEPNAMRYFTIELKNTGTIDAMLDLTEVTSSNILSGSVTNTAGEVLPVTNGKTTYVDTLQYEIKADLLSVEPTFEAEEDIYIYWNQMNQFTI